ncbi:MAG: ribbon-helix-helix domain-containing protein [Mycobacterium sp.]
MRTTVNIDDDLYREVKEAAARSGRTVAAVFEDAVRRGLAAPESRAVADYQVRAMGSGGLRPGIDLASNAELAEVMEDHGGPDALR